MLVWGFRVVDCNEILESCCILKLMLRKMHLSLHQADLYPAYFGYLRSSLYNTDGEHAPEFLEQEVRTGMERDADDMLFHVISFGLTPFVRGLLIHGCHLAGKRAFRCTLRQIETP